MNDLLDDKPVHHLHLCRGVVGAQPPNNPVGTARDLKETW